MNKKFLKLVFLLNEELHETASAMILDYPFTGISTIDDNLEVFLDYTIIKEDEIDEVVEMIISLDSNSKLIGKEIIDDKNWNEEWEKNVPAINVSENIGIAPSWKINELTQKYKIIINPKMSFGTGEHATTRLVCKLMENSVKHDSVWADIGTGTGVLAIFAAMLGAQKVIAFDNNHWCYLNSEENIKLNNLSHKIELFEADIESYTMAKFDGIVANLFVHLVVDNMEKMSKSLKKGGDLIISGILNLDSDKVISSANQNGLTLVNKLVEDEWAAFHFVKGSNE